MTKVDIPVEVMERVNAELARSILEHPDYISKVIEELMKEGTKSQYDVDSGRPLFERILRSEVRRIIEASMLKEIRAKYAPAIEAAVAENVAQQEKVEGTLAQSFARMIDEDWKVDIKVEFAIRERR